MIELPPQLWLPPKPAIIRPAPKQASFLPGWFPAGGVGKSLPELTYIGQTADEVDRQTYTFTNHAIGAADPTRRVVVAVNLGWSIASGQSLGSATIGGVGATIHVNQLGSANVIAIISALVPTGTTATIVINASGASCRRCRVAVFRAINESSSSPHNTQTDIVLTGSTLSVAINIPDNGWVMAASAWNGNSTNTTWVGATLNFHQTYSEVTIPMSTASQAFLPVQTGRTVSGTATLVPGTSVLGAISWG